MTDTERDAFGSDCLPLIQIFRDYGKTTAGFSVPVYQRKYTWSKENIKRLYEDVAAGLCAYGEESGGRTFLGAIILIDEKQEGDEQGFNAKSFSVVDGQQRLTVTALTCCRLIEEINTLFKKIKHKQRITSVLDWIENEIKALNECLLSCVIGCEEFDGAMRSRENCFPRITRKDSDRRAWKIKGAKYESEIGRYLHEFGFSFWKSRGGGDEGGQPGVEETGDVLNKYEYGSLNLKVVKELLDDIVVKGDFGQKNFLRNYEGLYNSPPADWEGEGWKDFEKERDGDARDLIRLIAFGRYFLDHVVAVRVQVKDEGYAYDIFEALNTTGEPLTAIETFKSLVIRYEGKGYQNSESKRIFGEIEEILDKYNQKKRQSISKDLVCSFALYLTGKKENRVFSLQRKYLTEVYGASEGSDKGEERKLKENFLSYLLHVLDYGDRFWGENLDRDYLYNDALVFLKFFKKIGHSLTIPILTRYYQESKDKNNPRLFVESVQALAAFVILRRAATEDTKGIDDDFRSVMRGVGSGSPTNKPLKRWQWEGKGARIEVVNSGIPSLNEFRDILRSHLRRKILVSEQPDDLLNELKKKWKDKFTDLPHKPLLAKMCLLLAYNHSIDDDKNLGLLCKGKRNPETNCLTLEAWGGENRNTEMTIEHVMPKRPKLEVRDSSVDIYSDKYAIDSIGNLVLLPKWANSVASNYPWEKKRPFYRAFAEKNLASIERIIKDEDRIFSESAKKYLKDINTGSIRFVSSLSKVEDWNKEFIKKRAENLADLIWYELAPFLGLKNK